jgi:hypothetical protein
MPPATPIELLPWHVGGGNLAGQATGRAHVSHTALSSFLACPQRYEYSYQQRLSPRTTPPALTLGKAYQLSIEHADPLFGAVQLTAEAKVYSNADAERVRAQAQIVQSASELYLERYGPAQGKREFEYLVRLRNPRNGYPSRTYDLLGYADEWIDKGSHAALVENKLVGQITELSIRRLPLDRQLALECYGTWRATGMEVREVFYRMMRKPSIRQKKGESIGDYCERISADYQERPDFYCVEEHLIRTADDLLRTEVELWEWASQLRRAKAGGVWTRNTSQCAEYGGCAFVPLCLGEPGAEGLFSTRTSVESAPEPTAQAA